MNHEHGVDPDFRGLRSGSRVGARYTYQEDILDPEKYSLTKLVVSLVNFQMTTPHHARTVTSVLAHFCFCHIFEKLSFKPNCLYGQQ